MAQSDPQSDLADEQLLAEASREGSEGRAFSALLARHRERVWRICYRLMGNEHDASDAAQEVFVRLFLNRWRFEGRSQFATWLHGIAVKTCLGLRRSRSRRAQHETQLSEPGKTAESRSDCQPASRGLSLDLEQMLETLDEEDRAMVILKHAEGHSYEELAEMFDLSVSACKMRVSRACERLRQLYPEQSS